MHSDSHWSDGSERDTNINFKKNKYGKEERKREVKMWNKGGRNKRGVRGKRNTKRKTT